MKRDQKLEGWCTDFENRGLREPNDLLSRLKDAHLLEVGQNLSQLTEGRPVVGLGHPAGLHDVVQSLVAGRGLRQPPAVLQKQQD
eukprot:scaffold658438_cov59-Prasinocladus_malaysianus.AAC.1